MTMNIAQTRETIERLQAMLEGAPPEVRDKIVASLGELGSVLTAIETLNRVKAKTPVSTSAMTSVPPPSTDWKLDQVTRLATDTLKASAALDKPILQLIAARPKSQRQIQRDIQAVRDAWQDSFGRRRAILAVLGEVHRAESPEQLAELIAKHREASQAEEKA